MKRIALTTLFLITACSSLEPVQLPSEYTPAPAETSFWTSVHASPGEDWHVLLNNGPQALDWRLRAIDSATETIDLQTFLLKFDTTGAFILDHLLSAADRGVLVRMLIDDTFLAGEDQMLLALSEHPNVEYRVFNPFKRRSGGLLTRQLLNLGEFGRLDHRMHNKSMTVDNRVAIVGGRNLADEYFGLDEEANFRDLELLLGGPVVQDISDKFDLYWNDRWSFPISEIAHQKASIEQLEEILSMAGKASEIHLEETEEEIAKRWREIEETADFGDAILFADEPPQGNPENPEEAPVQVTKELIELFENAREEIIIVTAYLIPTPRLEGAVTKAVARGVRVRILTNSIRSNNHLAAHSAYRNHIGTLLKNGAELHEVRVDANDRAAYMLSPVGQKMLALHAKALIIDNDKVFIGSANLDPRSLRINTEMGFLVISEPFNQTVRNAVEIDLSGANAWRLDLQSGGDVHWVTDNQVLTSQPSYSFMQDMEDWFLSHLPIESSL
jgi:putative cardiolipin synthase